MDIQKLRIVLREDLNHTKLEKYTVKAFCEKANVDRNQFYYFYSSMSKLLIDCFEFEIKRYLLKDKDLKFRQRFIKLLIDFKANTQYYHNMLFLIRKKRDIYQPLLKVIDQCLANYCQIDKPYVLVTIKSCSSMLGSSITDWIEHDCPGSVKDFYERVYASIELIEKQNGGRDMLE